MRNDVIILDIAVEIRLLKWALGELDMPRFDIEALLSRLFDCFLQENEFDTKLHEVCVDMSRHDALFENEGLDQYQQERIYTAVDTLGREIKKEYDLSMLYVNGEAPYHFKRLFNGTAIIVAETTKGFKKNEYCSRYP